MKKFKLCIVTVVMSILMVFTSCYVITVRPSGDIEAQTLTFVEARFVDYVGDAECVGLFFEYTNNSGEDKTPGTSFYIGVRQKTNVLSLLWLSNELLETSGAISAYTSVSTGTTIKVVYLFVLIDKSPLVVVISDGREFIIEYKQIVT